MTIHKKIKLGKVKVEVLVMPLTTKKLIVLKAKKGYAACGYFNLAVAEKFGDAALQIVGVSSFKDALNAKVHALTTAARNLGIVENELVKDALKKLS